MQNKWRQAIIVGASSGMGAEIARQLAASGCRVALVARRRPELEALADEINRAAGPDSQPRALVYSHDVTCSEQVPALFQQICRDLGGLEILLYTAGVMPPIAEDEYSFEKDRLIIDVNVLGAIAWISEAAQRFTRAGAGTIVGISSVAGDRGRRGNPVYCASKAALNAYLEAVRNRVARHGVRVITVKPGPVDTPMTHGQEKLPLLIPAPRAARGILAAAARGVDVAYVPGKWRLIMLVLRSIPGFLFKKMNI